MFRAKPKGIEYEQTHFGTKATVRGAITPVEVTEMRRFHVQELDLNYAKGWIGSNISFLPDLPWLKSLSVVNYDIQSVEIIHCLHELRSLDIKTSCKTPIKIHQFPHLESFGLDPWRRGTESLFDCKTLRDLFIYSYTGKSSEPFKSLSNLERLQLLNCSLQEVTGFASLSKVSRMRLTYFRGLQALNGIEGMTDLEELEIHNVRGVHSIKPVCGLKRLRSLRLYSLGTLDTISGIDAAENLISFCLGDTAIEDGELSALLQLPQILYIGYTEKRHYKLRKTKLRRELARRLGYKVEVT